MQKAKFHRKSRGRQNGAGQTGMTIAIGKQANDMLLGLNSLLRDQQRKDQERKISLCIQLCSRRLEMDIKLKLEECVPDPGA